MEITDGIFQSFYVEEKIIDSDIIWKRKGDAYITDHINIISNTINDYPITFICKIDRYKKYAFNIVYRKSQTLIRYDMKKHSPFFKDKCSGQQLIEPHKHKFKKGCPRDLKAKIISEKEITRNDVNRALGQFFKECNIRFEGNISALVITDFGIKQTRLFQFSESAFNHLKGGDN